MAKRFWKLPEDLRREVIRLAAEHRTQREIVELTGVAKGSVWRVLRPVAGCLGPRTPILDRPDRLSLDDGFGSWLGWAWVSPSPPSRCDRQERLDGEPGSRRPGRPGHLSSGDRPSDRVRTAGPTQGHQTGQEPPALPAGDRGSGTVVLAPADRAPAAREFPDHPEMWVSHETIYKSLYVQGRGELRKELAALPAHRSSDPAVAATARAERRGRIREPGHRSANAPPKPTTAPCPATGKAT